MEMLKRVWYSVPDYQRWIIAVCVVVGLVALAWMGYGEQAMGWLGQ